MSSCSKKNGEFYDEFRSADKNSPTYFEFNRASFVQEDMANAPSPFNQGDDEQNAIVNIEISHDISKGYCSQRSI